MLDFDNEATLKRAIDYISYLSSYDYMSNMINEVHRQLGVRTRNLIQANNRDSNKFTQLNTELENAEKRVKTNKSLIENKRRIIGEIRRR